MRESYLAMLLMHLAAQAYAQRGVYLRPSFEKKWSISNARPFELVTNGYQTVEVVPLRFFSGQALDVGLTVGLRRQSYFIELGLASDHAALGYEVHGWQYNPTDSSTFWARQARSEFVPSFMRFNANYGVRLFGAGGIRAEGGFRCELWGMAGMALLRPISKSLGASDTAGFQMSSTDYVTWQERYTGPAQSVGVISGGLMLKLYNKHNHSVLNFTASLTATPFNAVAYQAHLDFRVYPDGSKQSYLHRASGGGLYLAVSKDIYLNRILKKRPVD